MKLLFGYLTSAYRGGTKYQLDMAGAFQKAEVGFITSNRELEYREKVQEIGPIHLLPPTRKFFQRLARMKQLAKEYDVIYLNKATLNPLELLIVALAGFKKVVFHSHATGKEAASPLARMGFHLLHYLSIPFVGLVADGLYACSESAARWLYGPLWAKRAVIINNAIDLAPFRYDPQMRERKRAELGLSGYCVIHVGAFAPVKNHAYLVDAFAALHRTCPDSTLLLVGDGELRQSVVQQVERLGLGNCVRFLGLRSDVSQLLQAADLLALTSVREGLPFTVIEAQAAGLPCVVTSTASAAAKITDLCDFIDISRSPEETAQAMARRMGTPRRDTFGELVAAGFELHDCAHRLETALCAMAEQ